MDIEQEDAMSRSEQIIEMRRTGLTHAEIGRRLGIGRERVRQLAKRTVNRKEEPPGVGSPLSTSDVARLLRINTNTVRQWSNRGVLKSYRIGPRGDRRFRREDIDDFLRETI